MDQQPLRLALNQARDQLGVEPLHVDGPGRGLIAIQRRRFELRQAGVHGSGRAAGLRQGFEQLGARAQRRARVERGLQGLAQRAGVRRGATGRGLAQQRKPLGAQALGLGGPVFQLLLGVGALAQLAAQARAQRRECGRLGGLQGLDRQGFPVAVERHQVVDGDQRFIQQSLRAQQQRLRLGTRCALRERRFEPLLGQPVHFAVVAAEGALSLLERGLAAQRRDGGQLGVEPRCRLRQLQQRSIVAQRCLQWRGPVDGRWRLHDLRRNGPRRSGALGRRQGRGRCDGGGSAAAFLEEPGQHGVVIRNSGGVGRRTPPGFRLQAAGQ